MTVFSVNLPWSSGSAIATGWAAMQDWIVAGSMPKEMNFRVFGSPSQTQLQGMYHGDSNSLRTAIAPLLTKLGASLNQAQQQDWMGAFTYYTYGSASAVEATLAAADPLVWSVRLFDVYRGAPVADGRRSLAFGIRVQSVDKTLTDAEVAEVRTALITAVEQAHGATLRA